MCNIKIVSLTVTLFNVGIVVVVLIAVYAIVVIIVAVVDIDGIDGIVVVVGGVQVDIDVIFMIVAAITTVATVQAINR